jgi:hypothetical protein
MQGIIFFHSFFCQLSNKWRDRSLMLSFREPAQEGRLHRVVESPHGEDLK